MIYVDSMNTKVVTVAGGEYTPPDSKVIKMVAMPYGGTVKAKSKNGPDDISVDGLYAPAGMVFLPGDSLDGTFTKITVTAGGPVIAYFTDKEAKM